jgi:hypothetical protein
VSELYIFNADAEKLFYDKLNELHEKYVYHLLLNGLANEGADLESIKMTKNPDASKKYCQRVVGGLVNIKPEIKVKLIEDDSTRIECIFTKINDNEHLNHVYMIQNVMNWPRIGGFSCQIWYLGETDIEQIKKHWNA